MSEFKQTVSFYAEKLGATFASIFPGPKNVANHMRSLLRGATNALALVASFSAFLTVALLVTSRANDIAAAVRISAAGAASAFGQLIAVTLPGAADSTAEIGVHSGLLALLALVFAYRTAKKRAASDEGFSSLHFALGYVAFIAALAFATQGLAGTALTGVLTLSTPSWFSLAITFVVFWSVASMGKRRAFAVSSSTVWGWATRTLKNFAQIYASLLGFALIALLIAAAINPTFEIAHEPAKASFDYSGEQVFWGIVVFVLFSANALVQLFFATAGVSVGLDVSGTGAVQALSFVTEQVSGFSFWILPAWGPWAYAGVVALVAIVALVSGSVAARQLKVEVKGIVAFWQGLIGSLFVVFSVAYFAGIQGGFTSTVTDAEQSGWVIWGASSLGLLVSVCVVVFVAFGGANKLSKFTSEAFPKLWARLSKSDAVVDRGLTARVFGIVVSVLLVAAYATPITAATVNRVWAAVDGPAQLGEEAGNKLTNASISDLKKFLAPKGTKSLAWLDDAILKSAQPKTGFDKKIEVVNSLDKPWTIGNLDATVKVSLTKGKDVIKWDINTTSEMTNPFWLISHPEFKLDLEPNRVNITFSKLLPKKVASKVTVNGKDVKVGSYFAIPGSYEVKASGYKLIAPTKRVFFTSGNDFTIKVGTDVLLPKGASSSLDSNVNAKAATCFTPTKAGGSDCYTLKSVLKKATLVSGTVPEKFFDASQDKFTSTGIKCDATKAKDKLVTAVSMTRTTKCSGTVNYVEHYYASAKKTVPVYETQTTCSGAMQSNSGTFVYYNYDYGRWEDDNYWYYDDQVSYNSCAYEGTKTVQTGTKTVLIRGKEIAKVTKTSKQSASVAVTGNLTANDKFTVKK